MMENNLRNQKFNWDSIIEDSIEIVVSDVRNGATIQKLSQLFEKLKEKYEAEGKTLPTYNTYRQTMRKKLNISANKTNIRSDLYRLAGSYDKMTFPMLAENFTISSSEISGNACWLFARIREKISSDHQQTMKLMYHISHELKKKYKESVLFISFDNDTLAILYTNKKSRKKISVYFEKHGNKADFATKGDAKNAES